MKKKFLVSLAAATMAGASAFALASCTDSREEIKIWVSETEGVTANTQEIVQKYLDENELSKTYRLTIAGVSESKAATDMIGDVKAGADVYTFAQDQLARLIAANAIAQVPSAYKDTVKSANSDVSIAAASVADVLYAYPMTADNGYFMYYNKDIITNEEVGSLEKIIAKCESTGKKFSMHLTGTEGSAWYGASFYFGAGCVVDFETDSEGQFSGVNDTMGSDDKGLIGAQGVYKLVSSSAYVSSESASDLNPNNATASAVVVSGTWDYNSAVTALGDKLGVAKLPTYTVNNKAYQMGSFTGCKLLGVKPQTDVEKAKVCHAIANVLSNETSQLDRFDKFGWGPSNKNAQNSDAVKANATLNALNQQNAFATVQGQFHDSWWTIGRQLQDNILKIKTENKDVSTQEKLETELKACLKTYRDDINAIFEVTAETYYIWVGENQDWANNKKDTNLFTKNADGTYTYELTLTEPSTWGGRITIYNTWTSDFGAAQVTTGADLLDLTKAGNDNNMVFKAAGTYTITLTLGTPATITIVKTA